MNKNLRLVEFQGSQNRVKRDEARVTLNGKGIIHLNKKAFEEFGSPAAVKLFFDENELVIALKPCDLRHKNAFEVKPHHHGNTRLIHIQSFCTHHKIRHERTVRFNDIEINNEGTMLLWLKNITHIGRRWN